MKQGNHTIEECWNRLQRIWMSVESKEPNPMQCPEDIKIYTKINETRKVYQFLTAIDDRYDAVKMDILKRDPLPSVQEAYATIRRETARTQILRPEETQPSALPSSGIGAGLATRQSGMPQNWNHGATDRYRPPPTMRGNQPPRSGGPPSRGKEQREREKAEKDRLVCSHCGATRHIKDQCFEIVGYPEWWVGARKSVPSRKDNRGTDI